MQSDREKELRTLLAQVRELLTRTENRFEWSGWENSVDALEEFDALVTAVLEDRDRPARRNLKVLFIPTGPIQEVSISSGWGREFLALSDRIDQLL